MSPAISPCPTTTSSSRLPRHLAEPAIALTVRDRQQRVTHVGAPSGCLGQRVDGAGAHVDVLVPGQLDGAVDPQLVARMALVLLARIARQRVQRPAQDLGIVVVEAPTRSGMASSSTSWSSMLTHARRTTGSA